MSAESVLAFEGVTIRYGRAAVVEALSLSVPRGGVYALLGRNGAGKSSLLRCALGMQKPRRGRVRLLGADPWATRQRLMARVGVVPETPDAPPELTPRQLQAFCGRLHGVWDGAGVVARLTRLRAPLDTPFRRLAKGEKGAVMLALALGHRPELLVLDDPTLGLDVIARDGVFGEVIGELADSGTSVFLTSHDLTGVERIADRVGILHEGRLVVDEDLAVLKDRLRPAPGEPLSLEEIFAFFAGAGAGRAA
jgi:ABC-2 type transport system ATP-binding protein